LAYVHEPFNIGRHKKTPLKFWFEHVHENTSHKKQQQIKKYLRYFYSIYHVNNIHDVFKVRSFKEARKLISKLKSKATKTIVLKDPIAFMSAKWIYHTLHADVVVVIRHPAAFVASLKAKDWHFNFNDFLGQNALMDSYLKPYASQIEDYAKNKRDIVDQGILLWNVIYTIVLNYKEEFNNNWYFVKHEDLSENPIHEFEKLFHFLNIEFSDDVVKYIQNTTTSKTKNNIFRDSKANRYSWKKRLFILSIKTPTLIPG